jgi:hypothetical protein
MTKKFCTNCGGAGYPVRVEKGSTGTAFLLWITFLLPGIIYSIWRANSEHEACPACGSPQVIPVDSPMAQKLMGDDYRKMKEADALQVTIQLEARAESLRLAKHRLKRSGWRNRGRNEIVTILLLAVSAWPCVV